MFRIIRCIFLLLVMSMALMANAEKIALIVAVGDYPEESGWAKINSANDVQLIKSALKHHGFREENIYTLIDEKATKAAIVEALKDLNSKANAGDVVFFHFSGHGQQIIDIVGDEIDGLDESLVPYDAGMRYDLCMAKGDNHIRDDLLGVKLDKIRKKIGPSGDLIVVLDACHSGTATRNIGVSRGTDVIFCPPDQLPAMRQEFLFTKGFIEPVSSQELSPIVVFSGSSATEQNYEYFFEGTSYGSLSFAISRALHQVSPNSTYRSIFGKVRSMMSSMVPRQNPQIEGDADRLLFAGEAVEQMNYTTVKLWRNNTSVLLDAGQLNGINTNAVVELHPIGTINPSQSNAIGTGTVVNAQLAEALVILDQPLTKEEVEKSWVFVKEYSFGRSELAIQLSENIPGDLHNNLERSFRDAAFVKIVNKNPELLVEVATEASHLTIVTRDDRVLTILNTSLYDVNTLTDKVIGQIKLFAQAQLLRSLESSNDRLRVGFELIPVTFDENFREISRSTIEAHTNRFGQIVFNDGDFFKVRITNHGRRAAYYTLLDIQPDNVVNILIPEKDAQGNPFRAPSDCRIEPGQTEELRGIFYIKEPYGQEVFKMISSNRPLNLDQILVTRGHVADRSLLHPFEALFAESFNLLTRDSGAHRLPPEAIHIETLVFEIAPGE